MATKKRTKPKTKKRPTKKYARTGKILTRTVYAYVEPGNHKHAIASGKKPKYGTTSAYINALIARDRGVKPAAGTKGQELGKAAKTTAKRGKKRRSTAKASSKSTGTKKKVLYVKSVDRKKKTVTFTNKKPKRKLSPKASNTVNTESSVQRATTAPEQATA